VAHTIGHVAATVSMSKVAVSFTHIIKSGEPAFSVLVSRFMLGEAFAMPVYLSLLPIIGGCALAAVTELNFNMIGKNKIINNYSHKYKVQYQCSKWINSCFRIYGSYDIKFGICIQEYILKERNEWDEC
jgi:hypothetical protein